MDNFEGCLFVSSFCLVSFGKIACILFADAGADDLFTGFTKKGDVCLIGDLCIEDIIETVFASDGLLVFEYISNAILFMCGLPLSPPSN